MAALTEEQTLIQDQAKSWAVEQAPVQAFRQMRDSGIAQRFDNTTWSSMVELGWTGILVAEEFGGSNLGYLTFSVILEELGRQLTASPLFASALVGATALNIAGSPAQQQALLPKIVDGSEILTLALEETPRHAPEQIALSAQTKGDGLVLNGQKTFVSEGMAATTFIVAVRTTGGITLVLVPAQAPGLSREALATMDSRGYAQLNFDNVAVAGDAILGTLDQGGEPLQAILDRARAGLSAEMLGTGSQAFDMTLEYLKTRQQFGRVIGSFQALGHRAASLFTTMELSRSCAEAALQAIDAGADDVPLLCSLAKCRVGEFLHEMSNQLIQIHGGIGMTDEFDAGFYLKRARVLETMYGNRSYHRDRYATLLGF